MINTYTHTQDFIWELRQDLSVAYEANVIDVDDTSKELSYRYEMGEHYEICIDQDGADHALSDK